MAVLVTFLGTDPQGNPQRDRRSFDQPLLRLGRSTECEIHLPDTRVALVHARLTVDDSGATLHAEDAVVQVNGRETRTAKLKAGDRVFVGPYTLEVEAPRPGVPLALTVRHVAPPRPARSWRRPFRNRLPVSKRRLSYLAFAAVLLLFLVAPLLGRMAEDREADAGRTEPALATYLVSAVGDRFTQSWNPGPVSRAHAAFGDDCRACHRFPLVQVRDFSCIACHKTIGQHVSLAQLEGVLAAGMHERRCAQCHLDHKGERMAPRSQSLCADCHRDIKHVAPQAGSGNATDFATDHPRFRLSLVDADAAPGKIRRVRLGTPVEERSNLKFNHALHLEPGGVRDPEGKRDARGMHDERGGRTILKCRDCHEPAGDGVAMAPISMDKHCRRCHSLAFEPKLTQRQVPHGSKAMETMLGEFYARLALRDAAPRANEVEIQRARPGSELTYQDRQRVLQIADRKTREALRELYETRDVCSTCHYVKRGGKDGWTVAPVRFTRTWMPKAEFDHAKHKTEQCVSCHAVTHSKAAKDVAMPDIANCRRCHVGARPVRNKVTSDCDTCHRFHASDEPWDPGLQLRLVREADQ